MDGEAHYRLTVVRSLSTPPVSDSAGLRSGPGICISEFPGDADTAGPGPAL